MSLRSPELTSKTRMNSILKPLINRISTPFSSTTNLWRHHHLAVRPLAAAAAAPEAAPAAQQQLARVVLKGGKAKLFTEHQNPIVYGGAVDRVVGRPAPKTGDPVLVCAGNEAPIAWGMYNPDSMYRVRIMQTADEVDADGLENPCVQETLDARLVQAVELRQAVGLPSTSTTVYRAVNSEGDRLSGLIVDVLGTHVVVSSSAAWVERRKSEIEATLLRRIPGAATIIWRPAAELAAEEGYGKEEGDAAEGDTESSVEVGVEGESAEPPGGLVVVENEAKFAVDPLGQKTGFYADQRDHRAFIRGIAAGREVLDVCCYSGGFALNAALGGAVSVLGIDSSSAAVALAEKNAELNGVQDRCSFTKADASEFMKRAASEGKQWDIVVLDPPKLAPSRKALQGALRKYAALNTVAMRLVKPGGLLMTCSCSGAVAQSGEFAPMLQRAATRAGCRLSVVRAGTAGPDHCIDPGYPEGSYLTNFTVRVA